MELADIVKDLGYERVIIRPSKHNIRAIRSYRKAGFKEKEFNPSDYCRAGCFKECIESDYGSGGDVFMELILK